MRWIALISPVALAAALLAAPAPSLAQTPPAPPAPPAPPVAADFQRYAATEVYLRDVAAVVRVHPEAREDVAVSIINEGPLPTPSVRVSRGKLSIDGGLRRRIRSCSANGTQFQVVVANVGRVATPLLPVIDIRTPEAVDVSAGGATRLSVGPSESATVRFEGCGDADVERVAGEAVIAVSGAPDLRLYEAGSATVALAGAGDVTVGVVHAGLTVSIAGSGDFVAARADGPTSVAVQGSGGVTIREGRANGLSVAIAGSGDVVHNGSASRLDAAILGSGDVRVRRVDGEVARRVLGSGDVIVGR